jgi:hypothetical protein
VLEGNIGSAWFCIAWDKCQLRNSCEFLSNAAGETGGGLESGPRQSQIFLIASGRLIAHNFSSVLNSDHI